MKFQKENKKNSIELYIMRNLTKFLNLLQKDGGMTGIYLL